MPRRSSTPFCQPPWSDRIRVHPGTNNSYSAATFASPSKKSRTKKPTTTPWQPWFVIRKTPDSTS